MEATPGPSVDRIPDLKIKAAGFLKAVPRPRHVLHGRVVVLDLPPLGPHPEEEVH